MVGSTKSWWQRTRGAFSASLGAALALATLGPVALADPGPAGHYIGQHPGDVFLRLDGQAGTTFVYRFDQGEFENPADLVWNPSDETEGLSVDKFERIITVKNAGQTVNNINLNVGEWMYYDLSTQQWVGPNVPATPTLSGNQVGPAPVAGRLYVPDIVKVVPCRGDQEKCNQIHWGHNPCPNLHVFPSGMSAANWPHPPVAYPDGAAFPGSAGHLRVIGFGRWFMAHRDDLPSNSVGNQPQHCYPGSHYGNRTCKPCDTPWNSLAKSEEIRVTNAQKQIVSFLLADDAAQVGVPAGVSNVGNQITTKVTSQTIWRLFASCGDSCLTGSDEVAGNINDVSPPTRILFGSEGQTIQDQAAYTIRNDFGNVLVVKRMNLNASNQWVYTDVAAARQYGTAHPGGAPFDPATDPITFGNAASLDSYIGGDDFIYKANADPDHYAVASRFWRTGGTAFHYDPATGTVKWLEHAFDLGGSFAPSSSFPQGDIRIGTNVYAITADGAGNLYWLFRDLLPPNAAGQNYPEPDAFVANPDLLTPAGNPSSWPTNEFDNSGALPGGERPYYIRQQEEIPAANNPQYPPYKRTVWLKQSPNYRLYSYNNIAGGRLPFVDVTQPPGSTQVIDRGRLGNGQFVRKYLATAPQVSIPPRVDVLVGTTDNTTVVNSSREMVHTSNALTSLSMEDATTTIVDYFDNTVSQPLGTQVGVSVSGPTNADKNPATAGYTRTTVTDWTERYVMVFNVIPKPPGPPPPINSRVSQINPASQPTWEPMPAIPSYVTTPSDTTIWNLIHPNPAAPGCSAMVELDNLNSCPQSSWSTGTHMFLFEVQRRRTVVEDHRWDYPIGSPGTYTWWPTGPGQNNPVNVPGEGLVEADFDLDMAAVNVTEVPPIPQGNTWVDLFIQKSGDPPIAAGNPTVEEDTPYTFRVENNPVFDGTFTTPDWGAQNGAYNPLNEDGDGVSGAFASSLLQFGFQWRWRVQAMSGAARYAYHDGVAADPQASNNGLLVKSNWETSTSGSPTVDLTIPGGTQTFSDPGRYLMVLDIAGHYWSHPAGPPLNFFSRPEEVALNTYYGVYNSATNIPMNPGATPDPTMKALAFGDGTMSDDLAQFDACNPAAVAGGAPPPSNCFARFYLEIDVVPKVPDPQTYVTNITRMAPTAPDVNEDMSDGIPGSMTAAPIADADVSPFGDTYTPDADPSDDVKGLFYSMDVNWYRAQEYVYDRQLETVVPGFGRVDDLTDSDMTKLNGVGTFFRSGDCPEPAANDANLRPVENALLRDGVLGSKPGGANGKLWKDCQTHVAGLPTKRDWQDIKFWWFMRSDDPDNPGSPLVPNGGFDLVEGTTDGLGVLVAQGDLGEIWEMQNGNLKGFRQYVMGNNNRVMDPPDVPTPAYPADRTFTVRIPLYGRNANGDPGPLEITVPTDPSSLTFTLVVRYPAVEWEVDNVNKYVFARDAGIQFGSYVGNRVYGPGVPSWSTDAISVKVLDRTAPGARPLEGLGTSTLAGAPMSTTLTNAYGANGWVVARLSDNNPFQPGNQPTITDLRYTLGGADADRRVRLASIWNPATTFGVGAMTGGGQTGFDLSFTDSPGGFGSFLRDATELDFVGAAPNEHNNLDFLYQTSSTPALVYATADDVAPYVLFAGGGSLAPGFESNPVQTEIETGDDAPRNWVFRRSPGGQPIAPLDENYKAQVWPIKAWKLPTAPFVKPAGADDLAFLAKGTDQAGNFGDREEATGSQRVEDFSPPNVIVELVDQKSGAAVYFSTVTDFRMPYGDSLPLVANTTPGDWIYTRVMVSEDVRPVMASEARAGLTFFGGRFGHPGTGIYDFDNLAGLPLPPAGDPAAATPPAAGDRFRWLVEEDVLFRVRLIGTDNSTPPDQLRMGIRSGTGSTAPHPFLTLPRNWDGASPAPTAGNAPEIHVVDGKAVLQGHHRYTLEAEDDVIEAHVEDLRGNRRTLRISLGSRPNTTDFRVISDRVRRGSSD